MIWLSPWLSPRVLRALLFRLSAARGFGPFDDGFARGPRSRDAARADDRSGDPWDDRFGDQSDGQYWPGRPAARESQHRSSRPSLRRKLPALTALALSAVLVAVVTIGVEAQLASRSPTTAATGTVTPPATFPPLPTMTAVSAPTPPDLTALGWVKRTLSWAERVASAPSSPSTVYACGGLAGQNTWVISFAVSQDGGHSWNSAPTTIQAAHCNELVISPSAPQAAAIYTDSCPAECGEDQQLAFYTLDAGAHWSSISSPCVCAPGPSDGNILAWVGTTLFAIPGNTNPARGATQYLAKSTNGGAFSWLTLAVTPQQLFTTANTAYAITGADIYKSTDLGSSWTKTSASYNDNSVAPLAMAPGAALVGIDARAFNGVPNTFPLLDSTDGGATWQQKPGLPAGLQMASTDVSETPDGTLYVTAAGQSAGQGGIYKLAPNASAWRLLSPVLPGDLRLVAVTWNGSGQPLTLWGLAYVQPGTSNPTSALYSHAS